MHEIGVYQDMNELDRVEVTLKKSFYNDLQIRGKSTINRFDLQILTDWFSDLNL